MGHHFLNPRKGVGHLFSLTIEGGSSYFFKFYQKQSKMAFRLHIRKLGNDKSETNCN